MSAEVVFNEVWTEDHNPLPPSLPPFSSSLSLTPESDRNRRTERQRRTASDRQIGVEGEKAMVELMGENEVFFFFYFITPSPHPSSCDHSESRITGPVRDTLKIFLVADTDIMLFNVYVRKGVCAWVCVMCLYCLCVGKRVRLDVFLAPRRKSLPTPTHNNPPQNYGFVVEDQPASLMHLKFVCLCVNVCVCMPSSVVGSHWRTAYQQRALDLDEGQHFR